MQLLINAIGMAYELAKDDEKREQILKLSGEIGNTLKTFILFLSRAEQRIRIREGWP